MKLREKRNREERGYKNEKGRKGKKKLLKSLSLTHTTTKLSPHHPSTSPTRINATLRFFFGGSANGSIVGGTPDSPCAAAPDPPDTLSFPLANAASTQLFPLFESEEATAAPPSVEDDEDTDADIGAGGGKITLSPAEAAAVEARSATGLGSGALRFTGVGAGVPTTLCAALLDTGYP